MKREIVDIEVYKNYFCITLLNYDNGIIQQFEIDDEREINDYDSILGQLRGNTLITFNGKHYDCIIINYILYNKGKVTNIELYHLSQEIITTNNYKLYKEYKKNTLYINIDLFLFWSKMLRLSKKMSLKSLAVWLNHPLIQELPYPYDKVLTLEEKMEVLKYNINDDLITLSLTKELKEEINLRKFIKNNYNIDCYEKDNIKIASEILLEAYCKATGNDKWEISQLRFEKPEMRLCDVLKGFDPQFELPVFKNLYNEILSSKNSFSKEIIIKESNTHIKLSYGIGGLHSVNKNEKYYSNHKTQIVTSDFASLYPNVILNYNCFRFPEVQQIYKDLKDQRIEAKKTKNKQKDAFLKLCLNGVSGILDQEYSWIYNPEGALRLRIIGQVILTKVIEVCILNNWKVISANTDGVEVIITVEDYDEYVKVLDKVAEFFNLQLEHEKYNKIIYSSVNDYVALTESGKIKQKGIFVTQPVIGNSNDFLIISEALVNYFIHDIPIKDTITKCEDIYKFCASYKISKDYKVIYLGEQVQQLNRFYVSKKGAYLYKKKKTKDNLDNVLKDTPVILFNKYEKLDNYHIDYKYYINKTQEVINQIEPIQLDLFK